jgi:benzoate membrane transport protein
VLLQPVLAGVVASLVGFASTFALVLAGLRAAGADAGQAASGLLALSLVMGVVAIGLAWRTRQPIAIAWSTPGAALLLAAGAPDGGFAAAVGAFLVAGLLVVAAGLWRPLERAIAAVPAALAAAMLAGVLLPVCLAPVRAVAEVPLLAAPAVLTWLVLTRVARRWAVPGALLAAALAVVADGPRDAPSGVGLLPRPELVVPAFDAGALLGLALPLFVVTMASQDLPGFAVLRSFGFRPPVRLALVTTGAASAVAAPFGAHAVNLAAITAALVAGPDAHPDPARRWVAAVAGGGTYLVFGLGAGVAVALAAAAPPVLVEAVAGLALLGALAGALGAALADDARREAAVVTFVVTASSIAFLGVGAPFWGLVAGLAVLGITRAGAGPRRS